MPPSLILRSAVVLAVITAAAAGCSDNASDSEHAPTPTSTPAGIDAILQYTNRWIDNSSVDLMSAPGAFIRATMESLARTSYGKGSGLEAVEDAGYPGFARALNGVIDPEVVGGNARKDQVQTGTLYFEVIRFSGDAEEFTAGVCTYGSMTAIKEWNGYKSSGRSFPSGSATIFSFGPDRNLSVDQQVPPKIQQRGPANNPSTDQFGTWVLTGIKILGADVDLPQCGRTLAPGTPQDAPEDYYVTPDPPPALPPSPGWPEGEGE